MKDEQFYSRLKDIWSDLKVFCQKLSIPTHSQMATKDLAGDLLRLKINSFVNDWLVVAYVPDSKDVESPCLRSPSSRDEKQIYDYLKEALHILLCWWKHKNDLDYWSITLSKLEPVCSELRKMSFESNRESIQITGVVAGLRKLSDLLKDAGPGRYTVRKANALKWDLDEVWADISLDVTDYGKGHSVSRKKKWLTHEEGDLKVLVEDARNILDNTESMSPEEADKSANKLKCLAAEIENLSGKGLQDKSQIDGTQSDLGTGSTRDSGSRGAAKVQAAHETDIMTIDCNRRIELIYDFCNWIDELIAYIKDPDKSREISKPNADSMGRQLNNLTKKIWPHINFDKSDLPYQFADICECENLSGEGVFGVPPERKKEIIERLQKWKDRALKDRARPKRNSTHVQNVQIQNFGILGNVQTGNVQTADHASVHEHNETEKKGIIRRIWWIIAAIAGVVGFIASVLGILEHSGWLQ